MKKYVFAVLLIILFSCKHTREIIKYDSTENLKVENKTETNQNVKTDSKINSENNSNKTEKAVYRMFSVNYLADIILSIIFWI